ncbi:phosphotransferase family protein [Saccharopolyspora rosea]|uniref:phosphotransferase family protein n=1 Tax=Saccharopolyspora rosea TaxID=524884 RepID=UPI0021D7D8FA|nr:aminoglycoside phosphotransferase family protein [Saccharopolyspora rosea]
MARLLRWLHQLDAPTSPKLPSLDPFVRVETRLRAAKAGLDPNEFAYFNERVEQARVAWASLEFELSAGPVHGDASVGNAILSASGDPVLIDLDGFACGPREWDLVQTAMYYERFGWHTEEEYRSFVEVDGYDLLDWAGSPALADIRETLMTFWLSQKAVDDQRSADEVRKRLATLRNGDSRRSWSPY